MNDNLTIERMIGDILIAVTSQNPSIGT